MKNANQASTASLELANSIRMSSASPDRQIKVLIPFGVFILVCIKVVTQYVHRLLLATIRVREREKDS